MLWKHSGLRPDTSNLVHFFHEPYFVKKSEHDCLYQVEALNVSKAF